MKPKNILIIKLSAIGDVVMATPVIRILRNTYPEARLSWLVEDVSRDIVSGNPLLDEVVVWNKNEWKRLLKEGRLITLFSNALSFAGNLRKKKFDVVYDLQGFMKSAVWAFLSGAKERIGLASKEGSRILMTKVIPWNRNEKRIGAQYLQFVRGLGLDPGSFEMDIPLGEEGERFVAGFRKSTGIEGKYAVLCPFSSKPQKEWMRERWAGLSSRLMSEHGIPSVILGGKGDAEAATFIEASGRGIVNMAGKTSLKQSAALVKSASLLIGGDTGLTHMGIAFNVPSVAIFGSSFPYNDAARDHTVLLYRNLDCSPCKRHPTCNGKFRCLEEITEDDVLESVSRVLGTQ